MIPFRLLVVCLLFGAATSQAASLDEQLLEASRKGDMHAIQSLIAQGAQVNPTTFSGVTPLFQAIGANRAETVRALLKAGADPNLNAKWGSPLSDAVLRDTEIVRLLIQAGAKANYFDDRNRASPLTRAANNRAETYVSLKSKGHYEGAAPDILETIKLLINAGADVNHTDAIGRTPLRIAVSANNIEIVRLLLKASANTDARNPSPQEHTYTGVDDPIYFQAATGYPQVSAEITELLLESGGDPNYRSFRHYDADFDAKGRTSDGYTALTFAARWGLSPVAEVLLKHGADSCIPREDGALALAIAEQHNQKRVTAIIRKHGKGKCVAP